MKLSILFFLLCFAGSTLFAQENQPDTVVIAPEIAINKAFFGIGVGFDYGGGIGIKLEYLPIKHLGIFGGLGYNLASISGNIGCAYKISPDKKICPNMLAFYGYNGAFKGEDNYASQYDMTSYGLTFGVTLDIILSGKKGDKVSIGLFLPIRSKKFMDNYDAAKNDSNLKMKGELLPIGLSIGYNFGL